MELLKQNKQEPNCFALAAVMVLRHSLQDNPYLLTNAHLEDLFEHVGHRGQEVWWPECSGTVKLRGIHPQEIIDWYLTFDRTLWLLERFPRSAPVGLDSKAKMIWSVEDADVRFWKLLKGRSGILIMSTHAVAWDGFKIYDSENHFSEILKYQVQEAWLITNY